MTKVFPLTALPCSQSAVICAMEGKGPMCERLRDLGFHETGTVTCLFSSVFGDPRAYRIKDTVVALRDSDACHVICKAPGGEQ